MSIASTRKTLWEKAPSPFLSTGIGSLPHHNVDSALEFSFCFSIPFLPQIPIRHPREYMILQALDGLPGLHADDQGNAHLEITTWLKSSATLQSKLDAAFRSDSKPSAFEEFEPSPDSYSCWKPFLYELDARPVSMAKIQLAGPLTSQWALQIYENGVQSRLENYPQLGSQIFQLVLARAIAMSRKLSHQGIQPLFFLDEPGLCIVTRQDPRHSLALQELKLMVHALKKEGVLVGIHCCSNTDWQAVLELGTDLVSLDVELSLGEILSYHQEVKKFLSEGGRFALGVIPTGGSREKTRFLRAETLIKRLKDQIDAHVGSPAEIHSLLKTSVYTPACGLALQSPEDAEGILECLNDFKK